LIFLIVGYMLHRGPESRSESKRRLETAWTGGRWWLSMGL
jgi:hypothetical protein